MFKRLLLALAMIVALAACNAPAATTNPVNSTASPAAPGLESPSSGTESMEPSSEPSMEPSAEPSAS
jgi:uncharacterized lipoprotein YajG